MGLLKKKPAEDETAPSAAEVGPVAVADDPTPVPDAPPAEGNAAVAEPASDDEAEAGPAASGADALLNMFQTTQAEGDDREVLLKMAGDVELTDLVDEMGTVAAALDIGAPSAA
ncbi:MAG: hypothetical protein KGK07_09520 [Chloroflexota bacterium]|nr:hypothetical protein [Chloroflexota bacterium]